MSFLNWVRRAGSVRSAVFGQVDRSHRDQEVRDVAAVAPGVDLGGQVVR